MGRQRRFTAPDVRLACRGLLLLTATAVPWIAEAQDRFPSKPSTFIVAYSTGSAADVKVRIIAPKLAARMGQPVIVENKPGANSTIGSAYVARAKPDGYTFMHGGPTGLSAAPATVKDVPYDPVTSFSAITINTEVNYVMLVSPQEKNTTLPQFLERMRRNPEQFPSGGVAIVPEMLNTMLWNGKKIDNTYVRYTSMANMMSDMLGGRLTFTFTTGQAALPYVNSGRLAAMAVSAAKRMETLPNTPMLSETIPGASLSSYTGFFLPAKTPRPIVHYLYEHFNAIMTEPAMAKAETDGGGTIINLNPEEADAYMRRETPKWIRLIKEAGIKPE